MTLNAKNVGTIAAITLITMAIANRVDPIKKIVNDSGWSFF